MEVSTYSRIDLLTYNKKYVLKKPKPWIKNLLRIREIENRTINRFS